MYICIHGQGIHMNTCAHVWIGIYPLTHIYAFTHTPKIHILHSHIHIYAHTCTQTHTYFFTHIQGIIRYNTTVWKNTEEHFWNHLYCPAPLRSSSYNRIENVTIWALHPYQSCILRECFFPRGRGSIQFDCELRLLYLSRPLEINLNPACTSTPLLRGREVWYSHHQVLIVGHPEPA